MPRTIGHDDHVFPWIGEIADMFIQYKKESINARKSAWRSFVRFIWKKNEMFCRKKSGEIMNVKGIDLDGESELGEIPSYEIDFEIGIEPKWIKHWIHSLVENQFSFQSCLNYFCAVFDMLIEKDKILANGNSFAEVKIKLLHRQILTLVKGEPHRKALPFDESRVLKANAFAKKIAILGITLGVRSRTLKNIREADISLVTPECGDKYYSVFLRSVKYCPVGRSRIMKIYCACQNKQQRVYCLIHGIKDVNCKSALDDPLPELPILGEDLKDVCEWLDTTSHAFRRTLALAVRMIHERFKIICIMRVNKYFFWRNKSKMYIVQYTSDWEDWIDRQFPIIFSVIDQLVMPEKRKRWQLIKTMGLGRSIGGYSIEMNHKISTQFMYRDLVEKSRREDEKKGVIMKNGNWYSEKEIKEWESQNEGWKKMLDNGDWFGRTSMELDGDVDWKKKNSEVNKRKKKDEKKRRKTGEGETKYGRAVLYNEANWDVWTQRTAGWVFESNVEEYLFCFSSVRVYVFLELVCFCSSCF